MTKESKTKILILECQIRWAKVFEGNRDNSDMHFDIGGQYSVDLLLNQEQVEQMKSLGVPETALGYQTFKEVEDSDLKAYKAKRPHISKNLKDENGERLVLGAPLVFDYNAAVAAWEEAGAKGKLDTFITPWTEQDGLIGNGSTAKVKLSIYRGMNKAKKQTCVVTLERIGLLDVVEYSGGSSNDAVYF